MSAEAIEEIIAGDADGPLACLAFLLGDGFADALAAAIMACLDEGAVKTLVVDCITNPDTSPITKELIAEVFQGKDLDEDGVLGKEGEGEPPNVVENSEGTKILTVTGSRALSAAPVRG